MIVMLAGTLAASLQKGLFCSTKRANVFQFSVGFLKITLYERLSQSK